jgi:hypothetical protein
MEVGMITIEKVDTKDKKQVEAFVDFHYKLYKGTPQWVPPFRDDIRLMLNKEKHPFYELNDADFFVAKFGDEIVGKVSIAENRSFNQYHKTKKAQFFLFDAVDDQEIANKLFERAFEWCKERKLDTVVGPKGFSAFDGYGILQEGYEHRQMMNMVSYNFPYYVRMVESLGFEKEVDFVSCYLKRDSFNLPEKMFEVAKRVEERGTFNVHRFKTKGDLKKMANQIGRAYNNTFINNWEYYPLTDGEVKLLLNNLLTVAVPDLIKIITHNDEIVGFLLAFPDVSAVMQKYNGNISLRTPFALLDVMNELKRTNWVSLNGAGVLPEFHGRGGNALLYSEMEKTIKRDTFEHAELTQVAETTQQMRKDLITAGGKPYKNHRVYHHTI